MKYKVGDKVRIKSIEWYEENRNAYGDVDNDNVVFNSNMVKYCGKEATIICVKTDEYYIDIDGRTWKWVDWMFEDEQAEHTIFDRIKSAIIEAAKEANILVEPTEDGGIKISPLEVKDKDLAVDTPCMVGNESKEFWSLRYYAYNGKVFINGLKSKDEEKVMKYDYIIPFDRFNPNNIEESLKYNIVK